MGRYSHFLRKQGGKNERNVAFNAPVKCKQMIALSLPLAPPAPDKKWTRDMDTGHGQVDMQKSANFPTNYNYT